MTVSTRLHAVLGLCLALGSVPALQAAPGALDSGFGTGGEVTTAVGSGDAYDTAVALQPDGKIVAAGYSVDVNGHKVITVVRYNPDGSLDTGFGGNGKVTTAVGSLDDEASAVAVQPDGRILVAGYSNLSGRYVDVLLRYNADGSLDAGFNGTGKVTTAVSASDDRAKAVALQPDGKILVAGESTNASNNHDFALLRYNTDGSLDTSFNGGGSVTTALGTAEDVAGAVAVQPDGGILVGGYSQDGTGRYDFAVVRYNADGSLDTTFNTNGMVTTPVGSGNAYAGALALQPDGKVLAAGYSQNGSNYLMTLVRYNADGTLDTAFNGTGIVTTAVGASLDFAHAVAVQPDGRIIVVGETYNGVHYDFAAVRYNTANGSLDGTFNGDGEVVTAVTPAGSSGYAVAVEPDGMIVAAGNGTDSGGHSDFALVRYLANDANNDGVAEAWGLTPAAFTFTAASGVALDTLQTSQNITVSGLGTGVTVPVTVTGGEYAIGTGAYTADLGYARNGDQISVRHTSAKTYATATDTVLSVGGMHASDNAALILGVSTDGTFTSTTSDGSAPAGFSFTARTGVPLATEVTSNAITVSGLGVSTAPISVRGGEYAVNGGGFTTAAGTVSNGDTVVVRLLSSSSPSTSVSAELTIGGVSAVFTVATAAATPPNGGGISTGTGGTTASSGGSAGGGALGPVGLLVLFGLRRLRRRA